MTETAHLFGKTQSLVGVSCEPEQKQYLAEQPAVILLNSGILHRMGPNRIYVNLARQIASAGFLSFRFDFSGVGDSGIREDILPLGSWMVDEVQEAMSYLTEQYGAREFVLMGICSGADAAFQAACADTRVIGSILIDGYAHSSTGFLIHSYARQLKRIRSWGKLLTGQSGVWDMFRRNLASQMSRGSYERENTEDKWQAPSVEQIIGETRALLKRDVALFFIYSSGSPAYYNYLKCFQQRFNTMRAEGLPMQAEFVQGADHGFTLVHFQRILGERVLAWISKLPERLLV